ncbi:MAG: DMT family transporter [Myxococcota bacterium]
MSIHDNVILADRETDGLVWGGLGVLLFSVSMVATRAAAPELGGVFVGLGRGLVAAVLAGAVILVRGLPLPARRHWPGLLVVAAGSVIGFPLLSAIAMEHVPASHGLIFTALMPSATALAAVVRAGERPSWRFWGWSLVAAALVIAYAGRHGADGLVGADALLAGGMVVSAVAYTEGGRLSRELGGMTVLSWALVFAMPVLLPAVAFRVWAAPVHGSPAAWLGFAYVSIFSMYVGFLCWYRGLARGGIARVSQLQMVQPLLGLGWCAVLLGEPLSVSLVVTAAAVIGCVAMGRR